MLSISEQGDPAGDAPGSVILLQEFNHRILNEYTVIIASLSITKSRIENVEARAALSAVQDRFHAMVGVHRALQAPMTGSVAIAGHVARVCESASQALSSNCRLVLQTEALEITLSAARAWRVGLILIELLTNAVKHGRPGSEVIVYARAIDGAFVCSVANESCAHGTKDSGAGQIIIEILADQIDGHLRRRAIDARVTVDLVVPVRGHLEVEAIKRAKVASRHARTQSGGPRGPHSTEHSCSQGNLA
jgi:two-component sensor histidine kinase